MQYDTNVIYRDADKTRFSWNGWTYYRTKSGKPKRVKGKTIEPVRELEFIQLKERFEQVTGTKVEC